MTTLATPSLYVFLCDDGTREELLSRRLIGTTARTWSRDFRDLRTGDLIVVYDTSKHEAFGTFEVEHVGPRLVRGAWRGRFPAQARVRKIGDGPLVTVPLAQVIHSCREFMRSGGTIPVPRLAGAAAIRVLELFDAAPNGEQGMARTAQGQAHVPSSIAREAWNNHGYATPQGFIVRSKAEVLIAVALREMNIECEYERPVPSLESHRCDFYLPDRDIYIEYWGTPNDRVYADTMRIKQAAYLASGPRLIDLYPADEQDFRAALTREIGRFDRAPSSEARAMPSPIRAGLLARLLRWLRGEL
ncbi:MAG: hypothetical protein ACTS3F_12560 [Phycisphaerales bacterium]